MKNNRDMEDKEKEKGKEKGKKNKLLELNPKEYESMRPKFQ